jgi:sec-independent protein translocase protein TatC
VSTFALRRGRSAPRDPEGRMPLMDHLRELRRRVVICVIALIPGSVIGWIYYDKLIRWLSAPVCDIPVAGAVPTGRCGPL